MTTLLDQYLKAVRMYLPAGAPQDDILSELAEHLESKLEEREAELGRPLTEVEQVALFGAHGNPMSVAERYGATKPAGVSFGRQIIGPELFPLYVRILAVNFALTLVAMIAIPIYQGRSVRSSAAGFLLAFMTQFVIVTTVFTFVDLFQRRARRRSLYGSMNWRFPPAYLAPIPRWQSLAGGAALAIGAALWALTPLTFAVLGGKAESLEFTAAAEAFYWPVLGLLIAGVGQRFATFRHPEWNALQAATRLFTNGTAVLLLYPFVRAYPYVAVAGSVRSTPELEGAAMRLSDGIWWMTLAGLSLYWVFNAAFHAWLCAQHVGYARRRRAHAVGT